VLLRVVVERSARRCLLCGERFTGRAFVCRDCANRYPKGNVPDEVLRRFYQQVDLEYPEWANTFGNYNPPRAIFGRLAQMNRGARILEIGSGGGFLLEELWKLGFRSLVGSDITPTALTEISKRSAGLSVVGADAEAIPFRDGSFDVALSSDLIEHLPRVECHLSEIRRILAPGGQYLFKTPNRRPAELYYRLRGLYDYHIWHPSMFSPGELAAALDRAGFDLEILPVSELTGAQLRKIPTGVGRSLARRFPLRAIPAQFRPHLEAVATLRSQAMGCQ
jgi:SAM-dependent methyltransferase